MSQQRVNLQYSVMIEQLPAELGRLIKNANNKINSISNIDLNDDDTAEISLSTTSQIEALRTTLAVLDHELMDINSMISGYINFKTKPRQEPTQEETELYSEETVLDDLESKIENFKKNFVNKMDTNDQITTKEYSDEQPVPQNGT